MGCIYQSICFVMSFDVTGSHSDTNLLLLCCFCAMATVSSIENAACSVCTLVVMKRSVGCHGEGDGVPWNVFVVGSLGEVCHGNKI